MDNYLDTLFPKDERKIDLKKLAVMIVGFGACVVCWYWTVKLLFSLGG